MRRARRPFEVFPEELGGRGGVPDHAEAIAELAAVVDALAGPSRMTRGADGHASGHRVLGPAGGQFTLTPGVIEAYSRRTLTWFNNCCDPCRIVQQTIVTAGCPPQPQTVAISTCQHLC